MIYGLSGKVSRINDSFFVLDVAGVGYKVFSGRHILGTIFPGEEREIFCHMHVREDLLDLYGFLSEPELEFFEQLISVSGVGPRSALAIMDVSDLHGLVSAIQEGRADLLTQASGIGRKTAERIVLDLRGKVKVAQAEAGVRRMDADSDLLETLVNLGYRREQVKSALEKVDKEKTGLEERLKEALKILSGKQ